MGTIEDGEHVRLLVWKPLAGQTWPVQSVCDDDVVKVGRILFPAVGRASERRCSRERCSPGLVFLDDLRVRDGSTGKTSRRTSLISLFSSSAARSSSGTSMTCGFIARWWSTTDATRSDMSTAKPASERFQLLYSTDRNDKDYLWSLSHFETNFSRSNRGSSGSVMTVQHGKASEMDNISVTAAKRAYRRPSRLAASSSMPPWHRESAVVSRGRRAVHFADRALSAASVDDICRRIPQRRAPCI